MLRHTAYTAVQATLCAITMADHDCKYRLDERSRWPFTIAYTDSITDTMSEHVHGGGGGGGGGGCASP
jgi:hypothetical protein